MKTETVSKRRYELNIGAFELCVHAVMPREDGLYAGELEFACSPGWLPISQVGGEMAAN